MVVTNATVTMAPITLMIVFVVIFLFSGTPIRDTEYDQCSNGWTDKACDNRCEYRDISLREQSSHQCGKSQQNKCYSTNNRDYTEIGAAHLLRRSILRDGTTPASESRRDEWHDKDTENDSDNQPSPIGMRHVNQFPFNVERQ